MPHKDIEKRKAYHKKYSKVYNQIPENKEKKKLWTKEWRLKNIKRVRLQALGYYHQKTNHEHELHLAKKRYAQNRKIVINYYGGKCDCCGESTYEFLAINHINGGGNQERKILGQNKMISNIIKNNFPEKYNILCHNCNSALGFYKYCPHKKQ